MQNPRPIKLSTKLVHAPPGGALRRAIEEVGELRLVGVLVAEGEEGPGIPDEVLGEIDSLAELVAASRCDLRGFKGEQGSSLVVSQGSGDPLIVLLGTGCPASSAGRGGSAAGADETRFLEPLRKIGAVFARQCRSLGSGGMPRGACLLLDPLVRNERELQAFTEGLLLGSYSFDNYKTGGNQPGEQFSVALALRASSPVVGEVDHEGSSGEGCSIRHGQEAEGGYARGEVVALHTMLARDLINTPARDMTPSIFCEQVAIQAAEVGLDMEIWDAERVEQEGLGGLAGVSRGSSELPRLLKITYDPDRDGQVPSRSSSKLARDGHVPSIVLVGKGITFDSGGLSLKSAEPMATMKTDMSGAAAVCATVLACAKLGVAAKVTAIAPLAENMPGGSGIKPGDVLAMRNGRTVEVLNTDAEGRLILADAISLAVEMAPDAIVDIATLTGACVVALGKEIAGLFCNDEGLAGKVTDASSLAGERVWRLPLVEEYRGHIDSEIADMKNVGKPGQAGAVIAALMLERFTGGIPWAHLDIAGPARSEEDSGYLCKGGTGWGVRLLLELCSRWT
ncbi:MAG: leucyl aminopeptidase family protein [Acidimicrobiales bacterium]